MNPFCFFRAAQVVCLSSIYEGLPNVILEAMACGTPVLATDCASGPRELLGDGRYGRLVPPENAMALADALEDALTNYDAWRAQVPPARAWLVERHSLTNATRSLETLLIEATRIRQKRS